MEHYKLQHTKGMENLLQSQINIGDNITSKFNTLEDYVKDNGKCIASQINTLDMKQDHNVKHFEKVLNRSVSDFNKALENNSFKINSGQNEILSTMKEHDKTLYEIHDCQQQFKNVESEVKSMGEVLKSFDSHITDLKNAVYLIPQLHTTMEKIVQVMNATLGEDLIEPQDTNSNDTKNKKEDMSVGEELALEDTDIEDQENVTDVEPTKKTSKQRTSKRQTNRKKK
jgi:hypothetical protein